MHYNSFDFLKVFNFERVGGSEKELEAAKKEARKLSNPLEEEDDDD